jgi:hypothetical protein
MSARPGNSAGSARPLTAEVMNAADRLPKTPGLPGQLPEGEKLLWQGRPSWKLLAVRAFHVWWVAGYFGAIVTWYTVSALANGTPLSEVAVLVPRMVGLSCVPVGALLAYCRLTQMASVYTITSRRVVLKMGLVVPVTVNIPFRWIDAAGMKIRADGSGDVVVTLTGKEKLAWFLLWPHTRPWRMARPEPMLRGLRDARDAAQILARGLATFAAANPAAPTAVSDNAASPDAPENAMLPVGMASI